MRRFTLAVVALLVAAPALVLAQDWVASAPAHKHVLVDNPHFRLVDIVIPPGQEEAVHTHPQYVEYFVEAGKLTVTYIGKAPEPWNVEKGKAYFGEGEPPHSMKNVDTKPIRLLLLELKDKPFAPSTSTSGQK